MPKSSALSRALRVLACSLAAAAMIAAAPASPVGDTSLSLRSTVEMRDDGSDVTCTVSYLLTVQGNGHERVNLEVDYYVPDGAAPDTTETATVRVDTGQETEVLSWTVTGDVNGHHATMTASLAGRRGHDIAPASHDAGCDGAILIPTA